MRMRKMRSLCVASALLLAAAFAGAQDKAVTLTFGTHQSGLPTSGIVQKLGVDFEKETGIKIDFQVVPDAQWRDLLKAKIQAGEAPDIFCADADPLSLYDRVRPDANCIDLTKQEFVKRMDPSVLPAISYQKKVYGITFPGAKIWVYFYNKDIFQKLGIKAPTNYAEFKDICGKIQKTGVVPVYEALQNGWHQVLPLFESGPYYQTFYPGLYDKLNANTFNIKDIAQLKTIITQLKEFADLGYYGKDFMSNSVEGDVKAIVDGKAAMVLEGIGWGTQTELENPSIKGKLGIFVMPWGDNQIIGINPASNAYFGNVKSKHQKEILQFFAFLARKDNLQKRIDGDPQALAICWPEIKSKYPKDYSDYIKAHKTGTVMQAAVKYVDSQWMDVGKDLEAMYAGASSVDQVLQTISQRRDEQAKLQKDPAWK